MANPIGPYLDNPRPEVLAKVPSGAKRALDVGCWQGAFGGALKERGTEVWGIEYVPAAAEVAKTRLDQVFVGDCFDILPTLPEAHFDVITFNDVLEHLIDPWKALQLCKPILTSQGSVVVSLPNIRYFNALEDILLRGDFPYQEEGIFDRTHLRFFTMKSARRLFEDAGYKIETLEGINQTTGRKARLTKLLSLGRTQDTLFMQMAIVATPIR